MMDIIYSHHPLDMEYKQKNHISINSLTFIQKNLWENIMSFNQIVVQFHITKVFIFQPSCITLDCILESHVLCLK